MLSSRIISTLLKNTNYLLSHTTHNVLIKSNLPAITSLRSIYSRSILGIDGYMQSRERVKHQFTNMGEKFRLKMSEYTNDPDKKSMIFTEDLKNMIHLAEDDADVDLVVKMMKKFNQQNKEIRFGSFIFGPVVMRMFYLLNEPDKALECFLHKEMEGFFDQLMSYQILLDLLYENKKYEDVLKTFEIIKEKQIQGSKYPKNIVLLTMASLYKMNTKESLETALKLWQELTEVGHLPTRRATTFCAALALNHGKPEVALEIMSNTRKQNYMTVRNIKVAALSVIGRLEDALPVLRSVLEMDTPSDKKHTFTKDVVERIRDAVKKQANPTITEEFQRIEKHFKEQGHISDETLDQQLCAEITTIAFIKPNQQFQQQYKTNPYRNRYEGQKSNNNFKVYSQRPGLKELN